MNVLLDTHTFLWFVLDSPDLSQRARYAIEDPSVGVFVSVASLWEMAIKSSLDKLQLPIPFEQFIPHHIYLNRMRILPIGVVHLQHVHNLPFHHRDPFDRLLIAQSQVESMPIIGRDATFDRYGIQRIW